MTFKYFDNPEQFIGLSDSETVCDICSQNKTCFDATSFYGSDQLTSICPSCLRSGKLREKDVFTCTGDSNRLRKQLKSLHPDFTAVEVEEIARQKTIELEKTTPHLVTWQDWLWPCADADYCKFIGYGSKPYYRELATNNDVENFFRNSFYEPESYSNELWTEALPVKKINDYNDSNQYSTLFYVFKSLSSEKIITIWDCD